MVAGCFGGRRERDLVEASANENQLAALIGDDVTAPLPDGRRVRVVDADFAATTRPLRAVWERLQAVVANYGSVFRGAGPRSIWSSDLLEAASRRIVEFCGLNWNEFAVIFGSNTTQLINAVSRRLRLESRDRVFLGDAEHSSNDLPWRRTSAHVVRVPTRVDGTLALDALDRLLGEPTLAGGRKVFSFSGASNVTGAITPLGTVLQVAAQHQAVSVVDASQLVAHRRLFNGDEGLNLAADVVVFAGHKMYAPFGVGCAVIRRALLDALDLGDVGGGTVALITADRWVPLPDAFRRELAGSPNFLGIVGTALAADYLQNVVGFAAIQRHEQLLLDALAAATQRLNGKIDRYSPASWDAAQATPMVAFGVPGRSPAVVAQYLAQYHAISVRAGHLCQFARVERMLDLDPKELPALHAKLATGARADDFGVVRASFGIGSTNGDIQRLAEALADLSTSSGALPIVNGAIFNETPWFS